MPDPHWQRREAMIGRQSWLAPRPTWELRGFWTETPSPVPAGQISVEGDPRPISLEPKSELEPSTS